MFPSGYNLRGSFWLLWTILFNIDIGAKGAIEDCFDILTFVIHWKMNFYYLSLKFEESLQNCEHTEPCNVEIKNS